jgi:hypothetical protein
MFEVGDTSLLGSLGQASASDSADIKLSMFSRVPSSTISPMSARPQLLVVEHAHLSFLNINGSPLVTVPTQSS